MPPLANSTRQNCLPFLERFLVTWQSDVQLWENSNILSLFFVFAKPTILMLLHLPFTFIISVCSLTYTHTDMQLWRLEKTKCLRRSHEGVFTHSSSCRCQCCTPVFDCARLAHWGDSHCDAGATLCFLLWRSSAGPRLNICICPFLTHYDTALVSNSSRGWVQRVREAVRALQVAPSSVGR